MASFKFGKKLRMHSLSEKQSTTGTAVMLYGASGGGKTRATGTLPGVTVHLSFDNGASSAATAAEQLDVNGTHQVVPLTSLHDFQEALIVLKTDVNMRDKIDNIVVGSLVDINRLMFSVVSRLPRYAKDMLHSEDVTAQNPDKKAESSKMLPMYSDIQKMTAELNANIMELRSNYNIVMLSGEVLLTDTAEPGVYPSVNGPKSIRPLIAVYDEVYNIKKPEGVFDTKEKIVSQFIIGKTPDPATGYNKFAKTRRILDVKYLKDFSMPADFRLLFKASGYILKKDRKVEA